MNPYPLETLDKDDDDGTMPANVEELASHVVGHRITHVESANYGGLIIVVDNSVRVRLTDSGDCCAFTQVDKFLFNADKINHVITGIGTTDGYTTWHIYADMGDVLELEVGWSCGNPFYYGYGFTITVEPEVIVISESTQLKQIGENR